MPHASEYGFFLNIPRFLDTIYGTASSNGTMYPAVLTDSVYLVATQFCESNDLKAKQSALLNQALQDLPAAMHDSSSAAIVYALQAEVLLSYYFFNNNRKLEGAYHVNAAVSITLACKFQRIRSSRQRSPTSSQATYNLPPPRDAIEEGERINAFWTVFILDRSWAVALGSAPGLTDDDATGTQIDIPWPLDMASYENVRVSVLGSCMSNSDVDLFLSVGWLQMLGAIAPCRRSCKILHLIGTIKACWRCMRRLRPCTIKPLDLHRRCNQVSLEFFFPPKRTSCADISTKPTLALKRG